MEENTKVVYCPYIPKTVATIINGIVIWDDRWYVNLWYKFINRVIPKRRRILKNAFKTLNRKVEVPYTTFQTTN